MSKQQYDLIGDIHGYGEELGKLLSKMGYVRIDGVYQHPTRKVIFLGDFIDRGPEQKGVLELVMPMVRSGAALAVLGNHEYNALAYHTEHRQKKGDYLRSHSDKNNKQHQAFLLEYQDDPKGLKEVLDFFMELPLFLDLEDVRVVHAAWDDRLVAQIKPYLSEGNRLTEDLLHEAAIEGTKAYEAIETLLKGVEYDLPQGVSFQDKGGHLRHKARTQWWRNQPTKLKDATVPPNLVDGPHGDLVLGTDILTGYKQSEKPVFLGHYWFNSEIKPIADNVACLDYSVAKNGHLVAYRWSGEQTLKKENFVSVSADPPALQKKRYQKHQALKCRP